MSGLIWALVGMIVSFIGIYVYISKKFDQSEISEQYSHKKRLSAKYQMAKEGLVALRKKNNILKLYKSLSDKDKIEVLDKLQKM